MESDDLNAPLGKSKKQAPKLPVSAAQLVAGLLGLSGLVVVGWAAFVNDPLGGEPVAVVATKLPTTTQDAGSSDGREHNRHEGLSGQATDRAVAGMKAVTPPPPGSQIITIIDGSSGKSKEVTIPGQSSLNSNQNPGDKPGSHGAVLGAQKLLETSRHGAIPKIGPDGTRASVLYAHPRQLPTDRKDSPRIAIVISGLGISASGTADAFSMLPAPVTFALAPYGVDVAKLAEHASAGKHELLLQTPMEPFDYPDNDPGPQALLTSLTPEQNIDRLHWLMSRFQGYIGIASFMGARFTATEQTLAPVLQETAKRGLIFVDSGASTRSVAAQIAGSQNLPFAKADIVLDAVPTPTEIDRALARLEFMARESGAAVGVATAQPGVIAAIAKWTKKVESRGYVLVPISMVAVKAKSS